MQRQQKRQSEETDFYMWCTWQSFEDKESTFVTHSHEMPFACVYTHLLVHIITEEAAPVTSDPIEDNNNSTISSFNL